MFIKDFRELHPNNLSAQVGHQFKTWIERKILKKLDEGNKARNSIHNTKELEARLQLIRETFLHSIGGVPECSTPLNPIITGVIERTFYRIEKVIFESRPKAYVTGNLYIPSWIEEPSAAVMLLCGHAQIGKSYSNYQCAAQCLVEAGLIVFAVDPIGQGERLGYASPHSEEPLVTGAVTEHIYAGAQCDPTGAASARYFLHDNIRAIDYLLSREEVDGNRIGVMGASGGGTQTSMLMLTDSRPAAFAPVVCITDFVACMDSNAAQDTEQVWSGMLQAGFDYADILLAAYKKPTIILGANQDFFPKQGTLRTYEKVVDIYNRLGKAQTLEMFFDNCAHSLSLPLAKKAASFFAQNLLYKEVDLTSFDFAESTTEELNCTKSGQVAIDYPDSLTLRHFNRKSAEVLRKGLELLSPEVRYKKAKEELSRMVFWERDRESPLHIRALGLSKSFGISANGVMYETQPGLYGGGIMLASASTAKTAGTIVALWRGGIHQVQEHSNWIYRTLSKGQSIFVVDLTGEGNFEWSNIGPREDYALAGQRFHYANLLKWYGDSIVGLRSFEVLRAVDVVRAHFGENIIGLYGVDKFAVYTAIAAFVDGNISGHFTHDAFKGFEDWALQTYYNPYNNASLSVTGILKYSDLPYLYEQTNTKQV